MLSQEDRSLLGWLTRTINEDSDPSNTNVYNIHENEVVLIGRDTTRCQIVVDDQSVSNHHLNIYSIMYNDEPRQAFVYAQDLSTNGSHWIYKNGLRDEEAVIGRGCAVLLSDGDKIRICDSTYFIFGAAAISKPLNIEPGSEHVQKTEMDSFNNLYRMTDRQLGAGGSGRVLMAVDCFRSCQVACKIVRLTENTGAKEKAFALKLWREVDIVKDITHPNIIHIERVFHTENNMYIIENLIAGGDLRSYVDQTNGPLADTDASMIVYQILKALEYLHGLKIAHRDLKPENVLMSFPAVGARVILTDFGHSIKAPKSRMQSCVGTADYVAPEVHGANPYVKKAGYTMGADMWSVGALTTTLFLGRSYFADSQDLDRQDSAAAILEAASKCDLDALDHSPLWNDVYHHAKDFIKRLLVLEESRRARVKQALAHEWFTSSDGGKPFEERYQHIVKGWMPTRAAQDFQEDLKIFMNVRKEIDLLAMPPPSKPRPETSYRRPLQVTLNREYTSPYFSGPAATESGAGDVIQNDKRLLSVLNDGKENLVRPLRRKTQAASPSKITRPHDENTASSRSNKISIHNVELLSDHSHDSESGQMHPIQQQIPVCSPEDDEVDLYLRVGEERKGFRTAKSFGRAVAQRKNMKKL